MKHSNNHTIYSIICFLLLFTFLAEPILAKDNEQKGASSIVFQYERYVSESRYNLAEQWLIRHKNDLSQLIGIDEIKNQVVLQNLINDNLATVTQENRSKEEKLQSAMALVIAINTIENKDSSIWLNNKEFLENSVISALSEEQVSKNDLTIIKSHWEMLQPTYEILLKEDQYKELVATYNRIFKMNNEVDKENLQAVFRETQLIDVTNPAAEGNYLSFYWMIFIVGGIIIVTLAYVAWKKYKGEKKKKQKQHNS